MRYLCLVVALIGAAGCSSPARDATSATGDASGPVSGDWVIVRYDAEPESLNSITSTTTNAQYALNGMNNSQLMETLLQYDTKTWRLTQPVLALGYPEISPDHLQYTFTLRSGVKWHDGKPFTVQDALFSAKALMCPYVDGGPLRSEFSEFVGAEILDGNKIRFTVRKPHYLHADYFGGDLPMMPKHIFDPQGLLDGFTVAEIVGPRKNDPKLKAFGEQFNKHPNNRYPIGTGPYKFLRWETGRELVLVRNEEYWGAKPHLDRLAFRIITDSTAALTALKNGEVDMNPRLLPIQYSQQTSGQSFDQQFQKGLYTIPSFYYLGWNPQRPFFADKRVRQAMTMLVPRQQIIDKLRFGLATIAESPLGLNNPDRHRDLKPYPYDPKRAVELLDEAGWIDHDGDGIRDKDGVPFRFEFLGSSGSTFFNDLAPILKDELRKVGIDMTERRLEFTVQVQNQKDKKFDAFAGAWTSGLVSDPFQIWHSSSIDGGSNYVSFKNAEADKLIEAARLEFDPEKRSALYRAFQEILYDQQPYTFLFYPQEAAALHKRFQNVQWLPPRPGYDLNSWYVPKSTQRFTNTEAQ